MGTIEKDIQNKFDVEADKVAYQLIRTLHATDDNLVSVAILQQILVGQDFTGAEYRFGKVLIGTPEVLNREVEITRSIPLPNDNGGNVASLTLYHIPISNLANQQKNYVFLLLGAIIICYGLFQVWITSRILAKPFRSLEEAAQKVTAGDLSIRLDANRNDEFGRIAVFFNTMLDEIVRDKEELASSNRELKEYGELLEARVQKRTHAVQQQKTELATTLNNLKESQQQLILAEKMASLGQLVAGIAHEINTPAGAIFSAIEEVAKDYTLLLERLIDLMAKMPREQQRQYLSLCIQVLSSTQEISTKEQRVIARGIRGILDDNGIDNARYLSKNMAIIGLKQEDTLQVLPLMGSADVAMVVDTLYQLGMSQIHIRDIRIAIGRIIHLIAALKSYSHLDSGKITTTNLRNDLENTLIILNNKIKRAITVIREYQPVPAISGYADQLNQVWTNIIHNAIQAMRGDGNLTVCLYSLNQNEVTVEIKDTGPGIPAEILSDIFTPHFTTKEKGEGSGLGLAISDKIVRSHKGRIEVDSKPGKTCFRVILPVDNDASVKAREGCAK